MRRLAVVIVSWNVRELLASCLRSLFVDLEHSGLEADVWVVDNASTDSTPTLVADHFPAVHLIASGENLGFAAGNNLALEAIMRTTEADPGRCAIWLLNPDTEVNTGATAALLSALEAHASVGLVGAKLLYPDGSLQHGAFRFPGLSQLAYELFPLPARLYNTWLNGRYPRRLYDGDAPFPIDHPLGASMLVRAAAIHEVGLLDEGYRMYCEEIDWCWRMRKAGWRALCVPTAEVVHHAGQSTSQVPLSSFVNLWTSRARLYARHHGPLTRRLARAMVRLGMRRRMEGADPEMGEACREVVQAWEAAQ
ncbi:MAG: glycosyltransferase family 2 protein [Anaerolineae bacterium]